MPHRCRTSRGRRLRHISRRRSGGRHLASAATDVFVTEPYVPVAPDKDLRTLPNIVFTPHCGSDTFEANARMGSSAVAQAAAFLAGDRASLCVVPF